MCSSDLYVYKKIAYKLKKKYPNKIIIINIKNLNLPKIQKKLFDFLEIPKKDRIYQSVTENKGK